LIRNAIMQTADNGCIRVSIAANASMALVTVTDNGVGIAPQALQGRCGTSRSSSPAPQDDAAGEPDLPFCRLAVEAYGGRMGVWSEAGQGSMIWFTMPLRPRACAHPLME